MISWGVIMAKLENGTTVQELADACGTTYKNMWNRIRRHEVKDGQIYMTEKHLRPLKNRNSKRANAPELCPVTRKPRSPEECAECYESDCKGKAPAADPDNPKELLPVVKAEAIPYKKPEVLETKDFYPPPKLDNSRPIQPEPVTVTKSVYEQLENHINYYTKLIKEAEMTIETYKKQLNSWSILRRLVEPEEEPEEEPDITGGREI